MRKTIDRIKQDKKITLLSIPFLLILLALAYVVALEQSAERFYSKLEKIALGEASITADLYDEQAVANAEIENVRQGLIVDLTAAGVDAALFENPDVFEPLLQKATVYLATPTEMQQWLNQSIQKIALPREQWQIEKLDAQHQMLIHENTCFKFSRDRFQWRLISISPC